MYQLKHSTEDLSKFEATMSMVQIDSALTRDCEHLPKSCYNSGLKHLDKH